MINTIYGLPAETFKHILDFLESGGLSINDIRDIADLNIQDRDDLILEIVKLKTENTKLKAVIQRVNKLTEATKSE